MTAIYNEIEPFAAQWTRNLIAAGHVAPGVVDERSITELRAADVSGPGQRHFFSGIAVWSHALRLAGVSDDANVWTGSCPCQPFSSAGRGAGFDDARHLWPTWFELIRECRPAVVFGEQVASPDGLKWLDLVFADLEGAGYAVAAADLCAAGVGAPHIRQRLYFVAHADSSDIGQRLHVPQRQSRREMSDADRGSETSELADGHISRLEVRRQQSSRQELEATKRGSETGGNDVQSWLRADWVDCTDGKARPIEPGTFPLAHGATARVGRDGSMETQSRVGKLKAYGNAIVPQVAAVFIRAALGLP